MVEDARRVIIAAMTSSDSLTPTPARHPVRPNSRFTGLGIIALMIGAMVLIALVFLIVLQTRQKSAQPPASAAISAPEGVSALRDRLAADEVQLSILKKNRSNESAQSGLSLAQLQNDLAAISTRVGKLEAEPDPKAIARIDELNVRLALMASAQAALEARTAKLERINPSVVMRRAATELALINLIRASATTSPFVAELQALGALMPSAPEVALLAPIARRGAPSRAELSVRFSDMASQAIAAENSVRSASWLGGLWNSMTNLIVVRRVGYRKGTDSQSILARSEALLKQGDLAGAIVQLNPLKGAALSASKFWLGDAQARLTIERCTAVLANRMTQELATP